MQLSNKIHFRYYFYYVSLIKLYWHNNNLIVQKYKYFSRLSNNLLFVLLYVLISSVNFLEVVWDTPHKLVSIAFHELVVAHFPVFLKNARQTSQEDCFDMSYVSNVITQKLSPLYSQRF